MPRWTTAGAILFSIFHLVPIERIAERTSIRESCRARQIRTLQRAVLITAVFPMLIRQVNFLHPALLFISGENLVGFSRASWTRDQVDGGARCSIQKGRDIVDPNPRHVHFAVHIAHRGSWTGCLRVSRVPVDPDRCNRGETRDFAV